MSEPRAPRIFVMHEGQRISLYELSKRTEITYSVLRKRRAEGDEGARLIRPMRPGKKRGPQVPDDLGQMTEVKTTAKEEARGNRAAQLATSRAKIAAEHAAAFAKPLFDGRLLSKRDRQTIRERVTNCGQRNWCKNGGATY